MKPTTGKLEDEYTYATDCQFATLIGLAMRSRSPLNEITRQRNISYHMLKTCQEHAGNITWGNDPRRHHDRVQDILDDAKNGGLYKALNRFTLKRFDRAGDAARWFASFEKSEKDMVPR